MRKGFFCICFFVTLHPVFSRANSNDTSITAFLLSRISQLQATGNNAVLPGLFYSYISAKEKYRDEKPDENIFYNGLVSYTLRNIEPALSGAAKKTTDSILQMALPVFDNFKNTSGRNTFNFWRTDTSFEFPYTWWIKILRGNVTLPDDLDDTSLGLLALNAPKSTAESVHALMSNFINDSQHDLRNGLDYFKNYPAYSVWFGKNFPVVIDACVLTNILSFVQEYNLNWNAADSASLQLILRIIREKDYIKDPLQVSPYYGKASIFLYNLARLMSIKKIPELEAIKIDLITEAAKELVQSSNIMERIILSTAILKWGYIPPKIDLPGREEMKLIIEENDFSFFIGNIPSYLPPAIRNRLLEKNTGLFYHYCPAYNSVLLLEYITLSNNAVI